MIIGLYSPEELQQKREELREYCKLDILSTVRLHEKFPKMVEK
jgi:hypothetical protein